MCHFVDNKNVLASIIHKVGDIHNKRKKIETLINKKSNTRAETSFKNVIKSDENKSRPMKGTIPYYFGKPVANKQQPHTSNDQIIKRGTIPFYFQSSKRKLSVVIGHENQSFRTQQY